jgi:protein ImuA
MLVAPTPGWQGPFEAVLSDLREKIGALEGAPRRFGRTVSLCQGIDEALPGRGLPLGCVHELKGNPGTAIAFAGLLSARISRPGAVLYIEPARSLYPLGLLPYGVNLQHWVHVRARRQRDLVWTVLEALRCPQVNAVLANLQSADLTFSRRLQLAAESSGATGFLFGNLASAITRWRISPGRNSAWSLDLLYCRGGRPGNWQVAWRNGQLETIDLPARPMQRELAAVASAQALPGTLSKAG